MDDNVSPTAIITVPPGAASVIESLQNENSRLHAQIQELNEWLNNAVGEHDADMLQEIADIFSIVLERELEFDINVRFTGTFRCPPGVDPDQAIENFTFDMNEGYYQHEDVTIGSSDYQVEYSDWNEV